MMATRSAMDEFIDSMKAAWLEDRRAHGWPTGNGVCGLFGDGRWVVWQPGDAAISLGSSFTVEELEAIIAYVKANRGKA